MEEFFEHVGSGLQGTRRIDVKDATRGVIARHVTAGQVEKVRDALPKDLQALWPEVSSPPERSNGSGSPVRAAELRDHATQVGREFCLRCSQDRLARPGHECSQPARDEQRLRSSWLP